MNCNVTLVASAVKRGDVTTAVTLSDLRTVTLPLPYLGLRQIYISQTDCASAAQTMFMSYIISHDDV